MLIGKAALDVFHLHRAKTSLYRVALLAMGRQPLWHSLAQIDRALGDILPGEDKEEYQSTSHVVLAARWCRIVWKRLIGLSLLVVDTQT